MNKAKQKIQYVQTTNPNTERKLYYPPHKQEDRIEKILKKFLLKK